MIVFFIVFFVVFNIICTKTEILNTLELGIWKQGVKKDDFWKFGGRKSVTQFTSWIVIPTIYIDIAIQSLLLYII